MYVTCPRQYTPNFMVAYCLCRVHKLFQGEYYVESILWLNALLNLLNQLRKRDKVRGLSSISSLFCKEFNKYNTIGARMLDSYNMTLKVIFNIVLGDVISLPNTTPHVI